MVRQTIDDENSAELVARTAAGNGRFSKVGKEIKIATQHDAEGTSGQNGNKSWFFFSVAGAAPGESVTMKVI